MATLAELEAELERTRSALQEREELLRLSMVEKGEMIVRQLEERQARAYQAAQMRRMDPVTGLLRHGLFRYRLQFEAERCVQTGESMGLLLVDMDGFSSVNASLGYLEGDRVLRAVAQSVEGIWLARPGKRPPVFGRETNDCFGVLLPTADEAETVERAEEIRDFIERMPVGGIRLTASIGMVVMEASSADAGTAMLRAQQALKQAVAEGGNRVVGAPHG